MAEALAEDAHAQERSLTDQVAYHMASGLEHNEFHNRLVLSEWGPLKGGRPIVVALFMRPSGHLIKSSRRIDKIPSATQSSFGEQLSRVGLISRTRHERFKTEIELIVIE
jgi:hypothetical protein